MALTIYRVEFESGNGPLYDDKEFNICFHVYKEQFEESFFLHLNNLPPPQKDGLGRFMYENELCACESLEQLQLWFPPKLLTGLIKEGFRVFKIEVPYARVLGLQVVFNKYNITTKQDITEMCVFQ